MLIALPLEAYPLQSTTIAHNRRLNTLSFKEYKSLLQALLAATYIAPRASTRLDDHICYTPDSSGSSLRPTSRRTTIASTELDPGNAWGNRCQPQNRRSRSRLARCFDRLRCRNIHCHLTLSKSSSDMPTAVIVCELRCRNTRRHSPRRRP